MMPQMIQAVGIVIGLHKTTVNKGATMKKKIIGVLSVCMLAGLVSCGGNGEPTPQPTPEAEDTVSSEEVQQQAFAGLV